MPDFGVCLAYCHQEHLIQTSHGPVSVAVYGDQDKPALITYPDVALNCEFLVVTVCLIYFLSWSLNSGFGWWCVY